VKQYGWFFAFYGSIWVSTHKITLPNIDEDENGYLTIKDYGYIQHTMNGEQAIGTGNGFSIDLFIRIPICQHRPESSIDSMPLSQFYDDIDDIR
jgi:hypothetical protein